MILIQQLSAEEGIALGEHIRDYVMHDLQALLDQYWGCLRDKTNFREVGEWIEITTPYLDRHNDCLQIYAKRMNGGFVLIDNGYVLDDLEQSGCKLNSPNRQAVLQMTLNGFGVQVAGDALEIRAGADNFAVRKHSLLQAMLAVNDLFYLASSSVANLFYEDMVGWLELCDIRFTPNVKIAGKSGYDRRFDFVIPKSRVRPERVLRAINRPSRDTAQAMAFHGSTLGRCGRPRRRPTQS